MADGRKSPHKFIGPINLTPPVRKRVLDIEKKISPTLESLMERIVTSMSLIISKNRNDDVPCIRENIACVSENLDIVDETSDNSRDEANFAKIIENDLGVKLPKLKSPRRRSSKIDPFDDATIMRTLNREHHRRLYVNIDEKEDLASSPPRDATKNIMRELLPELEKSLRTIQLYSDDDDENELDELSILKRRLSEISEVFIVITLTNKARALAEKFNKVPGSHVKPFYIREKYPDIGLQILHSAIDERIADLVSTKQINIIRNKYINKLIANPLGKYLPKNERSREDERSSSTELEKCSDSVVDDISEARDEKKMLDEDDDDKNIVRDRSSHKKMQSSPLITRDDVRSVNTVATLRKKFETTNRDSVESNITCSPDGSTSASYGTEELISNTPETSFEAKFSYDSPENKIRSSGRSYDSEKCAKISRDKILFGRTRSESDAYDETIQTPDSITDDYIKKLDKSISLEETISRTSLIDICDTKKIVQADTVAILPTDKRQIDAQVSTTSEELSSSEHVTLNTEDNTVKPPSDI